MTDLLTRLKALSEPIKVGVIGVGNIGKGIVYQIKATPGMTCVAIADVQIEKAINWASQLNFNYNVVENLHQMHRTIKDGNLAVCADGTLVSNCDYLDVLVDSSNSVLGGLQFAIAAIKHRTHVVMMNSEADVIFGPYILAKADRAGVVYTSADGDQHTVLKRLINDIELWGFKTVLAGNMKGYLDRTSNPTSIIPEADKRLMDYKMCTSYTDGTKLNIEMALIANAIGGKAVVPGMLGPHVKDIYDVFNYFDFSNMWDGNEPIVDYVFGTKPPGGVFVVGYNNHPHQVETLRWYPPRLGPGPFYVFHRPYHIGHIEAMASIVEAYMDDWSVLKPEYGYRTNVYAYAKKELHKGDVLDGIGGYTCYGLIENCRDNIGRSGLPIGLADDIKISRGIPKDEKIFLDDILYKEGDMRFEFFESALKVA